jgi:hypothetical protein
MVDRCWIRQSSQLYFTPQRPPGRTPRRSPIRLVRAFSLRPFNGWLEGTLLGTIATIVAVISVASIGFMALTGRVGLRRAATVILGCFILFGASSIVAGLEGMARG